MTTQSAAKSTAAAKATPAKAVSTPAKIDEKIETPVVEEKTEETAEVVNRIPEALSANSILEGFCQRYLDVFDEISSYNKEVLAERDSEWTAGKVLEKAREFARPTDKNVKANEDIKKVLEAYESAVNALAQARKAVLDSTSKELGITLSATVERNSETEAPLKEKRKLAIEIGTQLSTIAKMTTDETAASAVEEFLGKNPLPAIGRDQARTFGADEKSTPKYRVDVTVTDKDGNKKFEAAGFTKASFAAAQYYERGKGIKPVALREAWEKAGNSGDKTLVNPVEFEDNGLIFSISKRS